MNRIKQIEIAAISLICLIGCEGILFLVPARSLCLSLRVVTPPLAEGR